MKKVLGLLVLIVLASNLEAQDTTKNNSSNIKPSSFALKLGLYDFKKQITPTVYQNLLLTMVFNILKVGNQR